VKKFRAALFAIGVLVGGGTLGKLAWRERERLPSLDEALAKAAELVEPGPLAQAHRGLPETRQCDACHATTRGIDDAKCIACHDDVGSRRRDAVGVHGARFTGKCAECHRDHHPDLIEFAREDFRHDLARFPLRGAHADLDCAECHAREQRSGSGLLAECPPPGRFRYFGIAFASCTDCHEDPHHFSTEATPTRDVLRCETCHESSAVRFTDLAPTFEHERDTGFALDSVHAPLDCAQCHSLPVFTGLTRDCAGCHVAERDALAGRFAVNGIVHTTTPSPHAGLVDCAGCHDTARERETALDLAARCANCHDARYVDLFHQQREHFARTISTLRGKRSDASLDRTALLEALDRLGVHDYAGAVEVAAALRK
jgi:Class III cytochrome C family